MLRKMSVIDEGGGLIDRRNSRAIFGAAERFERGSVEIKTDDVVDAFVKVAVEGRVFSEGDELGGGDLGGRPKDGFSLNNV